MTVSEWLGSGGVTLLLLAYVLQLQKVIGADKPLYNVLNFAGAAAACLSSWLISFMPFVVLEGVWALVSLISLIKTLKQQP